MSKYIIFIKKYFLIIFLMNIIINNEFVFAEKVNLIKIENYLNNISSLDAKIIQKNQNGNEIFGTIKLKKPGKIRIEYSNINQDFDHLIVGNNGIIAIIDYNSNSEPLRYPISGTPLKYLSEKKINLKTDEIKVKLKDYNDYFDLEIKEINPTIGLGIILLKFQKNPIKILGWEIPINETQSTQILLDKTKINNKLDDNLFYISAEIMKYKNSRN